MTWRNFQIGLLVFLLSAGVGAHLYFKEQFPDDPDHDRRQVAAKAETDAYYICEQFLGDRLKAPATAKFTGRNHSQITREADGGYLVRLSVDAQNSFGATLRNRYLCSVKQVGDGKWRLRTLVEG